MSNDELEMVAEHMGHSTNIHTNVYRLQQNLMERAKMARILLAAEQGSFSKDSTTQLEHIIIDEIPVYGMFQSQILIDTFCYNRARINQNLICSQSNFQV